MAPVYEEYNVENEIATFFTKAATTRSACDLYAKDLVGGDVMHVPHQGVCSYTVFAGPDAKTVVQFRLMSLALPLETIHLAHRVYGSLTPEVSYKGEMGEAKPGKETLLVYVMPRMEGESYLEFILAKGFPEDSPYICAKRQTLVTDVAHFFALSWKSPQKLDQDVQDSLRKSYERDLRLLLAALPERFRPLLQRCVEALPSIVALPMVLTHKDFGELHIQVDPETCQLLGVIDWAEAKIEPFGINLYSVESLMGKFHLRNGYIRHVDYDTLHTTFWSTLRNEVGGWGEETSYAIQSAMIMGQFLSRGFTSRLANMAEPVPIADDESGAYNMLNLDTHLINPKTKFA